MFMYDGMPQSRSTSSSVAASPTGYLCNASSTASSSSGVGSYTPVRRASISPTTSRPRLIFGRHASMRLSNSFVVIHEIYDTGFAFHLPFSLDAEKHQYAASGSPKRGKIRCGKTCDCEGRDAKRFGDVAADGRAAAGRGEEGGAVLRPSPSNRPRPPPDRGVPASSKRTAPTIAVPKAAPIERENCTEAAASPSCAARTRSEP